MNKNIFTAICDRLAAQVTELRWIDWDDGQLDMQDERAPVAFPVCLVDINYLNCDDQDRDGDQIVEAQISLRFAFEPSGATNKLSAVRAQALAAFDVMQKAHVALQCWSDNDKLTPLSRRNGMREKRRDGLKVYKVTYNTTFYEKFDEL